MGVGVDSIDLEAATELGILACNTPGANTTEEADHAMAMLLAQTRMLAETGQFTKAGGWSDNPLRMATQIKSFSEIKHYQKMSTII